jgi:hypothetical protein
MCTVPNIGERLCPTAPDKSTARRACSDSPRLTARYCWRQNHLIAFAHRRAGALQKTYVVAVHVDIDKPAGLPIVVEHALAHRRVVPAKRLNGISDGCDRFYFNDPLIVCPLA